MLELVEEVGPLLIEVALRVQHQHPVQLSPHILCHLLQPPLSLAEPLDIASRHSELLFLDQTPRPPVPPSPLPINPGVVDQCLVQNKRRNHSGIFLRFASHAHQRPPQLHEGLGQILQTCQLRKRSLFIHRGVDDLVNDLFYLPLLILIHPPLLSHHPKPLSRPPASLRQPGEKRRRSGIRQLLQLHQTPQVQRNRQRNYPSRHSRHQEEIRLVLVNPSQHPRDGFNKQLNETLDCHLHFLERLFSRLVKRLRRLLHILNSLPKSTHVHKRHGGGDRGDNGLRVEAAVYRIKRYREPG